MSNTHTEPVYRLELIDGREVQKPLPKKLHVLIQTYLIIKLAQLLPDPYEPMSELNVLTGTKTAEGRREYVVPDVVVVSRSSRYEDGDLAESPLWPSRFFAGTDHRRSFRAGRTAPETRHSAGVGNLAGEAKSLGILACESERKRH